MSGSSAAEYGSGAKNRKKLVGRLWIGLIADPANLAALLAFLLSLFIVSANLTPNLAEINSWDEAVYVNSGRLLLQGNWPVFASNPLVAAFYAVTSLPFLDSPFWMVQSTSLGRILLYGMLWIAAYKVARQLSDKAHPLIMVGLLFVSVIPVSILVFPSDPLFVAFAGLALAYALKFLKDNSLRSLGLSSLLLGLAALSRNDGLVLGVVLILSATVFAAPPLRRWKAFAVAAAPFLILVLGYVLFYGVRTGQFELGSLARTYDNFEAGHQQIYAGEGQINPVLEAKQEARRVFGTPEENQHSILRAVERNPSAYLSRLVATMKGLPSQVLSAYGVRMAAPILLLAMRGIGELVRRREFRVLSLMLLWLLPVLSGLVITLFRLGHIRFTFYVVFALAAIGLSAVLRNLRDRREQAFWGTVIVAFTIYGLLDGKPAVVYGMTVLLAAFALSLLILFRWSALARTIAPAAMLFLAAGLLLHGDFPGPKSRVLGQAADERAVYFMVENYPDGTPVASGSPGPVFAANMGYMGLTSLDVPRTDTDQQFLEWMKGQGIELIYVDASLYVDNPFLWEQVSGLIGSGLERVFSADEGNIQILSVQNR